MTLRVVAFFFALFAVSLGSNLAAAAEPVFPLGSRMGFVPPPGFQISKRFPGFENPEARSTILVATLPPQAYAEIEASMTADALKKQGLTEDKRQTLTLPKGKALLVTGSEQENGQKYRKWMFLGQLPEGVALIAVLVPETAIKTYPDDVIKASLATLAARASVPMEEQISLIPFKLTNLSGLRPIRVLGNAGVILTDGEKDIPTTPGDQAIFVVTIGQGGPEQATDRANFARNLFTGLGDLKEVRIISGDMLRLGGGNITTHELQADAKEAFTDTPMKLVQWVRFGQGSFIRMVGMARADQWPATFPRFRAVRDGVAPRD